MPALKMKTKSRMICSVQGSGLGVCKASKISKTPCSQGKASQQAESLDTCIRNSQSVSSNTELTDLQNDCHQDVFDGQICHSQSPTLAPIDSPDIMVRETCQSQSSTIAGVVSSSNIMESLPATCTSDLETIFSPIFESLEVHGRQDFYNYSVENDGLVLAHPKVDDFGDRSSTSCDYQTCNISDFHISDMTVSGLPFDGSTGFDDIMDSNPFSDHDMMFDISERYMILPFLEESVDCGNVHVGESCEVATMSSDDGCLYLAIQQMSSLNPEPEVSSHSFDTDQVDDSDSQMYIRNLADFSDVTPNFWPMLPREAQKRKSVTLVLDLDETLVHSTLDHCDDADFTFPVFFNMKEQLVYVRRRPFLQTFLERVAEMFEIVIFTASQSNYAEKLLNILDPEKKLISRRAYRDSCIFSDGSYTKDLTVLGVDLAKVAIVDNSPQVFRLQVNNGIPIKSWFDDPSDRALISLLPFLETLVDVDDVRPIIQTRFSNKE